MLSDMGFHSVIQINGTINSLCIVLMKNRHNRYYKILCRFPQQWVNWCCCMKHRLHMIDLEENVNRIRSKSISHAAVDKNIEIAA